MRGKLRAMKTYKTQCTLLAAAIAAAPILSASALRGAETNAAPERIGTYDSRVVAYAYFCSQTHLRRLRATIKEAAAAKAAGKMERFNQLDADLKNLQRQTHLQVFSTASVTNIFAEIKDRLPAVKKNARVSLLISMWDGPALRQHPGAQRVDVTDALAALFKPGEKQRKVIASIKRHQPIPLEKAERMKFH
jgi:hypothetical protein